MPSAAVLKPLSVESQGDWNDPQDPFKEFAKSESCLLLIFPIDICVHGTEAMVGKISGVQYS